MIRTRMAAASALALFAAAALVPPACGQYRLMEEFDGIQAGGLLGQDVDVYREVVVAGRPSGSASVAGQVRWWRYEHATYGNPGQQIITPGDPSPGDRFGKAVAIGELEPGAPLVLAVGAPRKDGNGAVYIFEFVADIWVEIQKIEAPFGSTDFGEVLDLVGTTTAGGPTNATLLATANEKVHVYRPTDTGFWFKEKTITPSTGYLGSRLRYVAINASDPEEIVVAQQSGNMDFPARVDVHKRTSGTWPVVDSLFPMNGAFPDQHFGDAVAFAGDLIVASGRVQNNSGNNGDPNAPLNGLADDPGGVHMYRRQPGGEFGHVPILPPPRTYTDAFAETHSSSTGRPLALSASGTLLVGAERDTGDSHDLGWYDQGNIPGNPLYRGAVHVIDVASGYVPTQTIIADDAHFHQWFGTAVAIDNAPGSLDLTMVVGAPADDDGCWDDDSQSPGCGYPNPFWSTGSVYIFDGDEDQDGIPSRWESFFGVDINGDGVSDINLPDANPRRKNLYLEIDSVAGYSLSPDAINDVIQAFANAPVTNPDGSTGITLHIDASEANLPDALFGCPVDDKGFCVLKHFKQEHFGTTETRQVLSMLKRYCVVLGLAIGSGVGAGDNPGGRGEAPGDDLVLFKPALDMWAVEPRYLVDLQAVVLMHELGHNLNLKHGGADSFNLKPNYPSIMNYAVAPYPFYEDHWVLDYSHEKLDTLDESSLDENAGITVNGVVSKIYQSRYMLYALNGVPTPIPLDGPIDWDGSGTLETRVPHDVTHDGIGCLSNFPLCNATPGQVLHGHNDWENLEYAIGRLGNYAGFATVDWAEEPTVQEVNAYIEALASGPGCRADLTDSTGGPPDGTVGIHDLLLLLTNWGTSDEGADIEVPDDVVNWLDLVELLRSWGEC